MFRSTSTFDKLLDKATSHLLLEPDWKAILQICDMIRQGDTQPKYALAAIKKKLVSQNPHMSMFALIVLESVVKNCGSLVHDEIGTKAYMEQLREFVKTTPHDNVKTKTLELIQAWAFAFRNSPKYRSVQDAMNIMKAEEYKFPALKESDAMFSADTAPEWAEGDCCHRCRVQFSLVQRKHHCRACGQVFCAQCSSRNCTLPKFGIEKEVRVCEACYNKLNKPTPTTKQNSTEELPVEYLTSSLAQQNQAPPPRKSEEELREEEELQLALALSQSEAEHKKTGRNATPTRAKTHSPPPVSRETSSPQLEEVDPELARYLNRSYWETRTTDESSPSAPSNPPSNTMMSISKQSVEVDQNGVATDSEMEEFVRDLKSQVEIFVNRMKSNSSRGRSIANDSSVQKLFMNITAMHSRLLQYIQQQDDSRVYYEGLQDKLVQVKDARAALDALRDEHREKLRREAEMAERQRQHQMAQKLDIMRKKKQEYLQYQRQLTLQRIQEQEREMQMRQEQQKQQYLMGSQYPPVLGYLPQQGYDSLPPAGYAMQPGPMPQGYPQYPPGMPGMMMPPQGYMPPPAAPPGPVSMMRPGINQMMPQMPQQMMPPSASPAHLATSQPGQTQMPGSHVQVQAHQHPMSLPQGQVPGPQGQMPGPQGQMPGPQGQMPGPQVQFPGPQVQIPNTQGPMVAPQSQLHMAPSQTQIPQGSVPNQTQHSAQSHLPTNQGQVPQMPSQIGSQHQMIPGAPMSSPANAPIQHTMMPPMGQPYQPQPPQAHPPQEQTAELISFD